MAFTFPKLLSALWPSICYICNNIEYSICNQGHAITKGLKDTIDTVQRDIGKRLYEKCLRGYIPDSSDLLTRSLF